MKPYVLKVQFVNAVKKRVGISKEATESVIHGFLTGASFSDVSIATGVPATIISEVFAMRWRLAMSGPGEEAECKRFSTDVPPPLPIALNDEILAAVRGMIRCQVRRADIRAYLNMRDAEFERYWKAAKAVPAKKAAENKKMGG